MMIMSAILYGTNVAVTRRQIHGILSYIVEKEGQLPGLKEEAMEEETIEEETIEEETIEEEITEKEEARERWAARGNTEAEEAEEEEAWEEAEDEEIEEEDDEESDHQVNISLDDVFALNTRYDESQDFQYSTRYFAVIYDETGSVTDVIINHISTVDEKEAVSFAEKVKDSFFSFGSSGLYFYKRASLDSDTIVVFLDSRNQVATNSRLLYTSLIVLGLGLIIVFFIMNHMSYQIIQPEIENVRRQEQFITNASHELKTPLAVIRANTEVEQMLHGEDEWNQSTLKQIDRMTGLIQNLVLICRAQEKSEDSQAILVNASKVFEETVKTYIPVATQDGKSLTYNISPDLMILGEESEIRQLITLLLDNAIKYCDEKGQIQVNCSVKGRSPIRLTVSNSYAEGANVNYDRFFDRFYRQDESRNIDRGGFGIGLSIAESLVQKYRGTLNASWKDGIISFTCTLKGSV